jgi:hypothetical protein
VSVLLFIGFFMKHELIFHLHIPKTAGSSVRSALLDSGWVMANDFKKHSISNRHGNLISGHFMFGAFPLFRLGKKTTYVTVLREPEKLMVSMYGFIRDRPNHPFHSETFHGFNEFWNSSVLRNIQARYLAGRAASFLYGRGIISDEILYKIAANNLRKIHFLGFQEDMCRLLKDLEDSGILDSRISSFEYRNVGKSESDNSPKFGYEIENFMALNNVDYRLYRLARKSMDDVA